MELDSTKIFAFTNIAHGYLLKDEFGKAKALYLKYKDVKIDEKRTLAQAVIDDFQELRKAVINHPDMEKIEALMKGN